MARRPSSKKDERSLSDVLETFGEQLVIAAREPNYYRYRPHKRQQAFEQSLKKNRLYVGGNRAGKTVAGVIEGIRYALGEHPYREVPKAPTRGRVVGTDFLSGIMRVLIPAYRQWVPPSLLINGSWDDSYSKSEKKLTLVNGSTIEFMSYEQEVQKFAGASRHWTHYDEEPPKIIFQECNARLVDTNGEWWMTLTPVLGLDYIYDEVYLPGTTPGHELYDQYGVVEVDTYDNTYLSREAIDQYMLSLSPEEQRVRRQGQFVQITGAVFPMFDREAHSAPESFKPSETDRVYISIDHGWRDHTAVLWHAVSRQNQIVTFDEVYVNHTKIEDICELIHRTNRKWGVVPFATFGDPAMKQTSAITGTSVVTEYAKHKVFVGVEGVTRDVSVGIDRMVSYLENELDGERMWRIVPERCPNLFRQMESIRWQRRASREDEMTLNKLIKIQDKDNHATDSARFFIVMLPPPVGDRRIRDGRAESLTGQSDRMGAVQFASRRDKNVSKWKIEKVSNVPSGLEGLY